MAAVEQINEIANKAITLSKIIPDPVYLLTNGTDITFEKIDIALDWYKNEGYWVVAIFENGHRVEA